MDTSFTSDFHWTFEEARPWANDLTKITGRYHTSIKGEPHDPFYPGECWAVTNRYDPITRSENK